MNSQGFPQPMEKNNSFHSLSGSVPLLAQKSSQNWPNNVNFVFFWFYATLTEKTVQNDFAQNDLVETEYPLETKFFQKRIFLKRKSGAFYSTYMEVFEKHR